MELVGVMRCFSCVFLSYLLLFSLRGVGPVSSNMYYLEFIRRYRIIMKYN